LPTVLVTGAAGFVGRAAVSALSARACVIAAVHKAATLAGAERVIAGDLCDEEFVRHLPRSDVVLHLAALSPSSPGDWSRDDYFRVNARAVESMLAHLGGGDRRFVYASTASIYRYSSEPVSEDSLLDPRGAYPESKFAGEKACAGAADGFESIVAARLFHPYGPDQPVGQLVPRMANAIRQGEAIVVPRMDAPRRTLTHISDVARYLAALCLLESGPRGFSAVNIGGDQSPSVASLASMIGKVMGIEPLIEEAGGSDESLIADSRLVRELTGMEPCMELERGISEYLATWDTGPAPAQSRLHG